MSGKRKCQDTDWMVVMLERTGRCGPYDFQQRPREVRVDFGRKKSLGSKMCKEISLGVGGGEVCVCGAECAENVWCTQTLYFFFPVSPRKLPHFPLLYSWQKGPRCFLVRPAYLPQSAFCSFRSSLRSAFSPNLFPFGIQSPQTNLLPPPTTFFSQESVHFNSLRATESFDFRLLPAQERV